MNPEESSTIEGEEDKTTDDFLSGIKIETTINKEDGTLPYGYYDPKKINGEEVTWICGFDLDKKITSVLTYKDGISLPDKRPCYLESEEKAREIRDELIKSGWRKIKLPEITFTMGGRKMNRNDKRQLAKKLNQLEKKGKLEEFLEKHSDSK